HVAPQRHPHAQPPGQLHQVAVVHAGQRQGIHALRGEAVSDLVAHRLTSMWSVARSAGLAGEGAPSNSARAAVVLGNAITSRMLSAPASAITTRSKPIANPPCGGAPACRPLSRNPKRASTSPGVIPKWANTRRCTAGSVIRIEPDPSSLPP